MLQSRSYMMPCLKAAVRVKERVRWGLAYSKRGCYDCCFLHCLPREPLPSVPNVGLLKYKGANGGAPQD